MASNWLHLMDTRPDCETRAFVSFGLGDRVRLSDRGRRMFTKSRERHGEVVKISATATSYRVRWDHQKTIDYVHWSLLELADEPQGRREI